MTWFNGMVEFFENFWLIGKWWFWEIVTELMHGYLRTPLVEGSAHHVVRLFFLFALTFAKSTLSGF